MLHVLNLRCCPSVDLQRGNGGCGEIFQLADVKSRCLGFNDLPLADSLGFRTVSGTHACFFTTGLGLEL